MSVPPTDSVGSTHYGVAAIRRSIGHFLVGRFGAGLATLLTLLIAIRALETSQFALYASLHALVLMLGLVSSCGVNPMLLRFIPELREARNNRAMYPLLFWGSLLRLALYIGFALIVWALSDLIAGWLELDGFLRWLPLYLFVGLLRVNGAFFAMVLESLLWQKEAQYSLALGALGKLAWLLGALWLTQIELSQLIYAELFGDGLTLVLLVVAATLRWRSDPERDFGDTAALTQRRSRMWRFAGWAYAQNLTAVLSGSAPSRLLVASFFAVDAVALFGVVDRLTDYVRRYEPTRLLLGVIRPVINARYRSKADYSPLAHQAGVLIRANLFVLSLPLAILPFWGADLLVLVTREEYRSGGVLLCLMYALITFSTINTLVDVLVKLVERASIYSVSNLVLSLSLLASIPLIPFVGLWSVPLASLAGQVVALVIIGWHMAQHDTPLPISLATLQQPLWQLLLSVGVGWLGSQTLAGSWGGGVVSLLVLLLLSWWKPPFRASELRQLKAMRRDRTA